MKLFTFITILFCVSTNLQAQIWEPHEVNFPIPTQGWRISPANDTVAWTFGFALDSVGDWILREYSYSRTTDGGNTWVAGTFPGIQTDGYFCSIFAEGPDNAWIAFFDYAEGGKIFFTTDGGQSWDLLNAPIHDVFISSIYFWDQDHGIIWGDPINGFYSIFTTSDGGLTWDQVGEPDMPPAIDNDEWTIAGNVAVNGDNIWFDTYYNRVFYSGDRGHTWSVWDSPPTTYYGLDLKADDDNFLYFIQLGEESGGAVAFELYRRHPDENTWTDLTPADNSKYISGFSHVPGTKTLVINLLDETRISYDHGDSWISVDYDISFTRGFTAFVDDQIGYCCQIPNGYEEPSENVYKYIGTPLSGLLDPKPIDITMTLTPNPAIDHIQLSIEGEQAEEYWILINDLNGKLMYKKEITNQEVIKESIDISTLINGMYTITVSNRNGLRTETFVKM